MSSLARPTRHGAGAKGTRCTFMWESWDEVGSLFDALTLVFLHW